MKPRIVEGTQPAKPVGIWIRVSTDDQARGESPEHHERRGRAYAEAKGWGVREAYHLEAVGWKPAIRYRVAEGAYGLGGPSTRLCLTEHARKHSVSFGLRRRHWFDSAGGSLVTVRKSSGLTWRVPMSRGPQDLRRLVQIACFVRTKGTFPTNAEIGGLLGITLAAAEALVRGLRRRGHVMEFQRRLRRHLEVTPLYAHLLSLLAEACRSGLDGRHPHGLTEQGILYLLARDRRNGLTRSDAADFLNWAKSQSLLLHDTSSGVWRTTQRLRPLADFFGGFANLTWNAERLGSRVEERKVGPTNFAMFLDLTAFQGVKENDIDAAYSMKGTA